VAHKLGRRSAGLCLALLTAAACSQHRSPLATSNHPTSTTANTPLTPPTTSGSTTTVAGPGCTDSSTIARWPVERRAAQLIVIPAVNGGIGALTAAIADGVGGVILIGGTPPADLRSEVAAANRAAAVPVLVMADEEGGGIQRLAPLVGSLPWPRQMAATMSTAEVEAAVAGMARKMRALGIGVDLAPVVDVDGGNGPSSTDPDGLRSFSADPATVARYSAAFVDGLRLGGVLSVAKHFPGLGGSTANTDYGPATTLPFSTLRAIALPPFMSAIGAGAAGVMVANASVPGLTTQPAALSSAPIQQVLRDQMGFTGLVLTDSLSAGAIAAANYGVPQAAVAAVQAGADMVLFGSTLTPAATALLSPAGVLATTTSIIAAVSGAVRAGQLPESRLNQAVVKVLATKGIRLCPS
jgi:beta-N-acetylhexosaminidase